MTDTASTTRDQHASQRPLAGSLVALPTPFCQGRAETIDFAAFRRLITFQVEAGSDGIVVAGTTGESATLSLPERIAVFEFAVGVAGGKIPVLAGIGTNDTALSSKLARGAERAGASALLAVTPYYNRPTVRGLEVHFGRIAEASGLPLVLYNVPSRTGSDLLPETAAQLAEAIPSLVAVKEASQSLERIAAHVALGKLDVFVGDDPLIIDGLQAGAKGAIGVVGNLLPAQVAELVRCATDEALAPRAAAIAEELAPLIAVLFAETNPAPLKAALALLGWASGELRGPLAPVEETCLRALRSVLGRSGLTTG